MDTPAEGHAVTRPDDPCPPITGETAIVAIVGDPIRQVKSPSSFNAAFARRGIGAVMVPFQLSSASFEADMPALMRVANLGGIVVTMPFKTRIMPMLEGFSDAARSVGAVNALRRLPGGGWFGDIFDGVGLVGAVRAIGVAPAGLRVGLIGAGGAGSAIAFALAGAGIHSLALMDREPARAAGLARRIAEAGTPAQAVATLVPGDLDLLVNASPVGMAASDGLPVDVSSLHAGVAVVDIVTRPTTPLLDAARRLGCRHAGGAAMVAAQTAAIIDFLQIGSDRA
ncbi:shikimate dehydrogenase family protein [Aureimonas glaciei]|jgi:shikimate dehydrogenase|uniref:Shikimate dehydrogenase n=1 Tax=Aureimonas glaciei TaxID=1776957 RepID=A0A916Y7P0_9HYPH|nr:shikimate dehydrogenase [Aureimonas glaciei]GGD33751.1 shikimate dehydrogenase [Aureimonas glaciei]